jgi:hypothetical protein
LREVVWVKVKVLGEKAETLSPEDSEKTESNIVKSEKTEELISNTSAVETS